MFPGTRLCEADLYRPSSGERHSATSFPEPKLLPGSPSPKRILEMFADRQTESALFRNRFQSVREERSLFSCRVLFRGIANSLGHRIRSSCRVFYPIPAGHEIPADCIREFGRKRNPATCPSWVRILSCLSTRSKRNSLVLFSPIMVI